MTESKGFDPDDTFGEWVSRIPSRSLEPRNHWAWIAAGVVVLFAHWIGSLHVIEFHPERLDHVRTWWEGLPGLLEHAVAIIVGSGVLFSTVNKFRVQSSRRRRRKR